MNVHARSRHIFNPVPPRFFRIVAILLISSMLVNGFVPRSAIDWNGRSAVAGALAGNSLLLQYFSLSVLPLTIVNTLFRERAASRRPDVPSEQDETGSNSSSEFSLVNGEVRLNHSRQELGCAPLPGMSAAAVFLSRFVPEARAPDNPALPLPFVAGALLLCYFLFARSSVNEDAVVVRSVSTKTRFR